MLVVGFIIGLFTGGIIVACLFASIILGKEADEQMEKIYDNKITEQHYIAYMLMAIHTLQMSATRRREIQKC